MALWVAAGSGRPEVATGELQGGTWRKKVPTLMCLGAEEIMISEIISSGCHPRVGSCKYSLTGVVCIYQKQGYLGHLRDWLVGMSY